MPKVLIRTVIFAIHQKALYLSTFRVHEPKNPYFMRGTDQYKQVSNKPFGDRTVRLTLEWGSRGRRFVSLTQTKGNGCYANSVRFLLDCESIRALVIEGHHQGSRGRARALPVANNTKAPALKGACAIARQVTIANSSRERFVSLTQTKNPCAPRALKNPPFFIRRVFQCP